jgi:hypothetical protein
MDTHLRCRSVLGGRHVLHLRGSWRVLRGRGNILGLLRRRCDVLDLKTARFKIACLKPFCLRTKPTYTTYLLLGRGHVLDLLLGCSDVLDLPSIDSANHQGPVEMVLSRIGGEGDHLLLWHILDLLGLCHVLHLRRSCIRDERAFPLYRPDVYAVGPKTWIAQVTPHTCC